MGLQYSLDNLTTCFSVLTHHQTVTDRRTDIQTTALHCIARQNRQIIITVFFKLTCYWRGRQTGRSSASNRQATDCQRGRRSVLSSTCYERTQLRAHCSRLLISGRRNERVRVHRPSVLTLFKNSFSDGDYSFGRLIESDNSKSRFV